MHMRSRVLRTLFLSALAVAGCTRAESPARAPAAASADADFQKLSDEFVADYLKRNPAAATYLGVHDYDDQLEDASRAAVEREVADYKQFRARFAAIDPSRLSLANQLDLAQVIAAIDSHLLEDEVIRSWAKNPDVYSSSITGTAYIMIKRSFAPPEVRLKALVARERLMLKTLEEGRKEQPGEPALDLHRHRDPADGRQHRLFRASRAVGVHRRQGPGAAGGFQGVQPGRRGRADPIQDVPAEGPETAVEGHLRDWR
jgi:hypothetical protein